MIIPLVLSLVISFLTTICILLGIVAVGIFIVIVVSTQIELAITVRERLDRIR